MRNPLRRKALTATPAVVEALQDRRANFTIALGGTNQQVRAAWLRGQQASYGWMYSNTPAVRAVVDYIARNVAQLGLKLYERVDDTERRRAEDHPAARLMAAPGGRVPAGRFICELVTDFLVYDNSYALKLRPRNGGELTLIRLPPERVAVSGGAFAAEVYRVFRTDGTHFDVSPDDVVHWRGYNPADPLLGLSRLETLRSSITEDRVSQATTVELMKNGLKGGHIERPLEAPDWSEEARGRFQEGWRNQRASSPRLDPVLEEGMRWVPTAISPKDAELLAGRRFTVEEIARVYGLPPEVVGLIESGGDLPEARKLVYTDVLPPITESLAGQLDQDLLVSEFAASGFYFEFDLNEKLRGDPVARFQAITSAVGAPWLTRNEARSLENRPPITGGDEIVTPLNVLVGDNPRPAPNVMPVQDPNKPPQDGSYRKALTAGSLVAHRKADFDRQQGYIGEAQGVMERYYRRQERQVRSKGRQRLDSAHFDEMLTGDIHALIESIVEREGGLYALRLGADGFDADQTRHYVKAVAESAAGLINEVTERDARDVGVNEALKRGRTERAPVAAASIGGRATIFARLEAARQAPSYELRRKTWVADTERHAEVDGETIPIDGDFSIGFGPGSAPNCRCSLSIT